MYTCSANFAKELTPSPSITELSRAHEHQNKACRITVSGHATRVLSTASPTAE
jgi:hypothetical protein